MWPDVVVTPFIDCWTGILKAGEPVQVQAVLPELAVETFHKGILGRLARLNEMQLYAELTRPEEYGLARQLRPVVADDGFR